MSRALACCPCRICVDRRALEARQLREVFDPKLKPGFVIIDEASDITPEMVDRVLSATEPKKS